MYSISQTFVPKFTFLSSKRWCRRWWEFELFRIFHLRRRNIFVLNIYIFFLFLPSERQNFCLTYQTCVAELCKTRILSYYLFTTGKHLNIKSSLFSHYKYRIFLFFSYIIFLNDKKYINKTIRISSLPIFYHLMRQWIDYYENVMWLKRWQVQFYTLNYIYMHVYIFMYACENG